MRRGTRQAPQGRPTRPSELSGPAAGPFDALHPSQLTSEQLINTILEAEPPEIYLMKDMKGPVTEASIMMSLTNLADKELVHMITWAKKIPGESLQPLSCISFYLVTLALALMSQFKAFGFTISKLATSADKMLALAAGFVDG